MGVQCIYSGSTGEYREVQGRTVEVQWSTVDVQESTVEVQMSTVEVQWSTVGVPTPGVPLFPLEFNPSQGPLVYIIMYKCFSVLREL